MGIWEIVKISHIREIVLFPVLILVTVSCDQRSYVEKNTQIDLNKVYDKFTISDHSFQDSYIIVKGTVRPSEMSKFIKKQNMSRLNYFKDYATITRFLGRDPGENCEIFHTSFNKSDFHITITLDKDSKLLNITLVSVK